MASQQSGAVLRSIQALFDVGTTGGLSDAELLEWFSNGPDEAAQAAFESLVARHGSMVLGVCRKILNDPHEAQDCFQATFLVLARKAGAIRRRDSLSGWLFGVARRVAIRAKSEAALRRSRERESVALARTRAETATGWEPEEFAALFEEIDRLPATYREPILLCYLEGMTYEAAAHHLKCPLGTLSTRLKRAKERLHARLTRRRVVPSPGMLFASLIPNETSAAVSASLAERTAMEAVRLVWHKAALAGTVSAPVASMIERTISAMKYRTLGITAIGLGVVVLTTTATLARRPAERDQDDPETLLSAKAAPSWRTTLSSGVTVEMVAVSEHRGVGTIETFRNNSQDEKASVVWRTPDGRPLAAFPYERAGGLAIPNDHEQVRDLVIRATNLPAVRPTYRYEVIPSGFNTVPSHCVAQGKELPGLSMVSVAIDSKQPRCKVRFGVASAPWETRAIGRPGDYWSHDQGKVKVLFGKARVLGTRSFLAISHTDVPDDLRVVAIDHKKQVHLPADWAHSALDRFRHWEVEFELPLSDVEEFQLQSRPFEWVVFDNVVLTPQLKSE